jgi:two-component system KDP operon response regulator KdpE
LARTVAEARAVVSKRKPDVVLVDPHRPSDAEGDVLRELRRAWPRQPILVVSRRDREPSIVAALELADDYIRKPFGPSELLARIRVALRRTRRIGSPKRVEPVLEVGDLRLDLDRHIVFVGRREVHLTPTEYRIFTYLMRHPGKLITHPQLLREVWGAALQPERSYLRVYIGQLRKKLETDPAAPRYLRTEAGVGYVLEAVR